MAEQIRELMTPNPLTLPTSTTLRDAARAMAEKDIGDVLVEDKGELRGVVTDRDIVVRGVAQGCDMESTTLADVCSSDLVTVDPTSSVGDAVRLMTDRAVRRLPVVEGGRPVGIVSIGDLATERDPRSALADISEAPPNN